MRTLISGGMVVDEGSERKASVIIGGGRIADITTDTDIPRDNFGTVVDATGCYVLPGIIDSHVHFREPGLTHKADIASESRAALAGGVTTFFDMPNTIPQTTSLAAWEQKLAIGASDSRTNYAFYPGATDSNADFLRSVDTARVPGIKLFMGASTGNMLVDKRTSLERIFALAAERGLILMAHCEDSAMIGARCRQEKGERDGDLPISLHAKIRSAEACYASSSLGAELARKYGTRFHVAHVTTARELELLGGDVTGEACMAHLMFSDLDYDRLGSRIKCNPAVKTLGDRQALRRAVATGVLATVSSDHAPHTIEEKRGGALKAASGMPMVQFSLPAMLTIADEEHIPISRIVQLMCHNQATLFGLEERGFLRKGYKADVAIVARERWTVSREDILSKCGWSPLEGMTLSWRVRQTFCNGCLAYDNGVIDDACRGEEAAFRRR